MKLLVFLTLTNVIISAIATHFSLERGVINIDYVICIILIYLNFKKIAYIGFIFTFISDLLLITRQVFPFFRLEDIGYILKFIFISSVAYQLLFLICVLYCLIACVFFIKERTKPIIYVYIIVACMLLFIAQVGFNVVFNKKKEWISSQIVNFISLQNEGFAQNLRMNQGLMQNLPYSHASKALYERLDDHNHNQIKNILLFVVNESLGMPKDPIVLHQLLLPLYNNKMIKSDININKIPYVGPTVYGELRELCHTQPSNFNLKKLNIGFDQCLPQLFKQHGYETTAVHGALGVMYDRKYWYPRAGFENMIFYESAPWKNHCYSFPGACDWELGYFISNLFSQSHKPQFIYWLTLNSHSIYDARDIHYNIFDCKKFDIDERTESCRNLKLQAQFFYVLSQMINTNKMKEAEVVIVGDHSPIIFSTDEKKQYFDRDNILILSFKVR